LEINAVKKRSWNRFACALIIAGIAPLAYLLWWENVHSFTPLSLPLSLAHGEYTASFTTDLNDNYYVVLVSDRILDGQNSSCLVGNKVIDSEACRGEGRVVDLDWKIVNATGAVTHQGVYRDRIYSGEEVRVGEFQAKRGSRQGIDLIIHEDVLGLASAHPRLEIQVEDKRLDLSYEAFFALLWALIIAGSGLVMTIVLLIRRWKENQQKAPACSS
jgi:hypothetical protein